MKPNDESGKLRPRSVPFGCLLSQGLTGVNITVPALIKSHGH